MNERNWKELNIVCEAMTIKLSTKVAKKGQLLKVKKNNYILEKDVTYAG